MHDEKWIGTSPSNAYWSRDSKYLLFNWNPENATSDSLYYIGGETKTPVKSTLAFRQSIIPARDIRYNNQRSAYTFAKEGDIYFVDIKKGQEKRITQTADIETNPSFSFQDTKIVYTRNQNLYAWDLATGLTLQLTDFQKGKDPLKETKPAVLGPQERWLQEDALENSAVLKTRKDKKELRDSLEKIYSKTKEIFKIYYGDKILSSPSISPDGRFVTYRLIKPAVGAKNTIVPNYVTESGFTEDIPGRTKVGAVESSSEFYIYDTQKDTVIALKTEQIPGLTDQPDYLKYYPSKDSTKNKNQVREVNVASVEWNDNGTKAVLDIYSRDHKDRWLMALDPSSGKLKLLSRQRDEAWIGGPGIGYGANMGWINDIDFWFQSEETGYSHLYRINVETGEKKALTAGQYEVQQAQLSFSKNYFYIVTNEVHPGEKQYYRLPVTGGKAERITTMTGANQVTISPDEKQIAILYSYMNKPWELYVQENKPGGKITQVTNLAMSAAFKSYPWREPELITFKARDGALVYARIYRPKVANAAKAGVLFVHGAGYLQNAHKWWSSYFHEYMFNNLLADYGYTVMDIDYRGSAGYGRDWRTGIYRHMGGKDLDDQVDAAKYMVEKLGVNEKHIGLYGGSYGGFITLMALFTQPDVFAAGAGLRSVTDWAHYNHGYTSNILNEPFTDSIAYQQSSPIYFAEGLKGHLLMCHGMVDQNVHFQDIVRVTQRLIELGKDNWELAVYPMEDHGFVEPSSWTDEYSRIFKLFETYLK